MKFILKLVRKVFNKSKVDLMICNKLIIIFETKNDIKLRQSTHICMYKQSFISPS